MACRLVVNADDFGISDGASRAIVDSHLNGCTTSTSVMANMPGFATAVALRERAPRLGFGAHLSLNVGRPLLGRDAVPALCDGEGWFESSFLAHLIRSRAREYRAQAYRELRCQIERLIDHGFALDHLNAQSHLHMIPALHPIFLQLQTEYVIPHLRVSSERVGGHPSLTAGGVLKTALLRFMEMMQERGSSPGRTAFIGLTRSGTMNELALLHYIDSLHGDTELMTHPGTCALESRSQYQDWVADYLVSPMRALECEALKSAAVKARLAERGVLLCTFREVYGRAGRLAAGNGGDTLEP